MNAPFRFNANDAGAVVGVQDVSGLLVGSFTITPNGYTWSTAVLTVVYGNGIEEWTAYPSAATITTTTRSSGRIDLSWVSFIALQITTAEGTSRPFDGVFSGHA